MSKIEDQPKQWWMFYPIKGLDITDKEHDLLEPMFGDCTFISRRHVQQIVPLLLLNERMAPGHDHERDIKYLLENATFREEFQFFIAVRRTGISLTGNPWDPPPFLRSAKTRAYEITALLSLVFLAKSQSHSTIGLVEQQHSQTRSLVMLDLQDGGFQFHGGGGRSRMIHHPKDIISLSRKQIQEILRERPFDNLSNALIPQNPILPKSLHRAIQQSTLRLGESIHTVIESSGLLGAVTSIEILMTDLGDSYQQLYRRMVSLLGIDAIKAFDAESVLQARHSYVHRGDEPEDNQTFLNAIGLALSCLLRSAEATPNFTRKSQFLDYLDIIFMLDKLAGHSNDVNQKVGPDLTFLKHNRSGYELPFLSTILVLENENS